MYTEKEAREKWCPMARRSMDMAAGMFTNMPNPEAIKCIAHLCMAWRLRRRYADEKRDAEISHGTGYCGLAGKP